MILNPKWCADIKERITARLLGTNEFMYQPFELRSEWNKATQFVILALPQAGRPYKVHQLGAGVKLITTDTDTCPCCKQRLKEKQDGNV